MTGAGEIVAYESIPIPFGSPRYARNETPIRKWSRTATVNLMSSLSYGRKRVFTSLYDDRKPRDLK